MQKRIQSGAPDWLQSKKITATNHTIDNSLAKSRTKRLRFRNPHTSTQRSYQRKDKEAQGSVTSTDSIESRVTEESYWIRIRHIVQLKCGVIVDDALGNATESVSDLNSFSRGALTGTNPSLLCIFSSWSFCLSFRGKPRIALSQRGKRQKNAAVLRWTLR